MLFKYFGILLLVALCVAHNGRRGGHGRSSGCQRSNNYGRSYKGNHHHHKEYHHQPRKKISYHEESSRKNVLSLVEDVMVTIIKPLCDKKPKHYEDKHERQNTEKKKNYNERYSDYSDEHDNYKQRQTRPMPRHNDFRCSFTDDDERTNYSDDYDDRRHQNTKRRNREDTDKYKQRRTEETIKREKYSESFESYKKQRTVEENQIRSANKKDISNNRNSPRTYNKNPKKMEDKKQAVRDYDYYDEDFPEYDYPEDRFPRQGNDVREPIQQPSHAYEQHEYYYYEDYSGFAF